MISPLEYVADAIMQFEGWHPGSDSFVNRNPGNLRKSRYSLGAGVGGFCKFTSLPTGYSALLDDLRGKFIGLNTHGLGPESTLLEMMHVYAPLKDGNRPDKYAAFIASYVSHSLKLLILPTTKLKEIYPPAATTIETQPAPVGV